jgi:glycosyltransferase involved in cell wall biosynthesis
MRPTVWVVSELYYPEQTSTGYFLTGIAETLADDYDVRVVCSQPTYSSRGMIAARREDRNGVRIERCRSSRFDKDRLILRAVNMATFAIAAFVHLARRLRRGDVVLVVTTPPVLPYVTTVAARLRGARVALLVHDMFPEVLVATGMAPAGSFLVRLIDGASRLLYDSVERVVVLGRDMRELVASKLRDGGERIATIPNWGDTRRVRPLPDAGRAVRRRLGIDGKFVVQFMGNMGRSHAMEALVEAAESLRDEDDIHFLLMGWGAQRPFVAQEVRRRELHNVTLLPNCSEDELPAYVNACDVAVITFRPGMAGVSVPSRMYNVLAAGKPILALADVESELARVILEEGAGWVVPAATPERLAGAIKSARQDADRPCKGLRARTAAVQRYSAECIAARYRQLFADLTVSRHPPAALVR